MVTTLSTNTQNISEMPEYKDLDSNIPSKNSHASLELIEVLKGKIFHYVAISSRLNTTYDSRKIENKHSS